MLIAVCYNLYFEHNAGRKRSCLCSKEEVKFKKDVYSRLTFIPSANCADQQSHFPYKSPEVVSWWVCKF